MSLRARIAALVTALVVLGGISVTYVMLAGRRSTVAASAPTGSLDPGRRLLVVIDRHLAVVPAGDDTGTVAAVECVRAYAAAGTGVCLRQRNPWAYEVVVLDGAYRPRRTLEIPGLPNRARVSASGRMVAWTTFVGGDSYAGGGFSTRTGVLDTRTGISVGTLEQFAVIREGRPYRSADLNFWGVTFAADDNRFYATMASRGGRYLVRGDFAARTVTVLRGNVECPSLSPDGTRVAFKQAVGGDPARGWRLSVLDLATMRTVATAETASVDDQAAWLDGATLAYTLRTSDGTPAVWAVPADGTGRPRLLVPGAESPAPLG
ncbi:hypothetical protein AB0J80_20515 [Actinoplanes sp. NPDC049548]|uniref:TolB family protein n=1 Tax=Actinoplanes sp. NPDC049548 TaxID=3155152 RepID=UPI00341EB91F